MKYKIYQKELYSVERLTTPLQFRDEFQIYPISTATGDEYKEGYFYSRLEYKIHIPEKIERQRKMAFLPYNEYESLYESVKATKEASKLIHLLSVISSTAFYEHTIDKGVSKSIKRRPVPSFSILESPHQAKQDEASRIISFDPNVIEFLILYHSRPHNDKQILDSVAHLIYHGKTIFDRMHDRNMSFLSYITSIEALVNIETHEEPEVCECCNTPKYKVTKKFTDLLKKYVGRSKKDKQIFSEIYDRRSKLAHTGLLFFHTLDNFIEDDAYEEGMLHHILSVIAIQAFKNCVLNQTTENNRSYMPSDAVSQLQEWRRQNKGIERK
jgi:hypothetical protein